MPSELRQDEKTVFFAMKIVFPMLIGLIVAASADIAAAKRGSGEFFDAASEACVACDSVSY